MIAKFRSLTMDRPMEGNISVHIDNEHKATVYVDDAILISYHNVYTVMEAVELFEEDYEPEWIE